MDLNALKDFVVIAQTGSFLAAAQRLGTATSTISRRMTELEKQLGVQLMERTSQGVKLTLLGQQCFEQALANLNALEDLAQQIQGNQTQVKGTLRLSIPQAFEPVWAMVQAFQVRYPQVAVHILATDRKLDLIAEGIDAAIRVGELETDKLIVRKLAEIRLQLVASPAFLTRYGTPSQPDQLAGLPCAAWSAVSQSEITWQLGEKLNFLTPHFSTNDYNQLRQVALSGMAICDLPNFLAQPLIAEGKLVEVLPDFPFPDTAVHLLYPSHRHPSSIVRSFVEFCLDWYRVNAL